MSDLQRESSSSHSEEEVQLSEDLQLLERFSNSLLVKVISFVSQNSNTERSNFGLKWREFSTLPINRQFMFAYYNKKSELGLSTSRFEEVTNSDKLKGALEKSNSELEKYILTELILVSDTYFKNRRNQLSQEEIL